MALTLSALVLAGCARGPAALAVTLVPADAASPARVRASGLSSPEASALASATLDEAGWQQMLTVRVAGGDGSAPPVAGRYRVVGDAVEFTPRFPFDAGRAYVVSFDPSQLPRPRAAAAVTTTVSLPKVDRVASTRVAHIWPSAAVLPENLLRVYIQFSAPMSSAPASRFVHLLDERGARIEDAFLPLDALVEFWSPDYTRYTVFFDPARVKRGIHAGEDPGRVLVPGRRYTIKVDAGWPDQHGLPLVAPFEYTFRVGPADDHALDVTRWRMEAPSAGARAPLVVTFPETMDHGLLSRALGVVRRRGEAVTGAVTIDTAETRWLFTPAEPWRAGEYDLVALSVLEDVSGNQIGRPFEVDMFDRIDKTTQPEQTRVPFRVR